MGAGHDVPSPYVMDTDPMTLTVSPRIAVAGVTDGVASETALVSGIAVMEMVVWVPLPDTHRKSRFEAITIATEQVVPAAVDHAPLPAAADSNR